MFLFLHVYVKILADTVMAVIIISYNTHSVIMLVCKDCLNHYSVYSRVLFKLNSHLSNISNHTISHHCHCTLYQWTTEKLVIRPKYGTHLCESYEGIDVEDNHAKDSHPDQGLPWKQAIDDERYGSNGLLSYWKHHAENIVQDAVCEIFPPWFHICHVSLRTLMQRTHVSHCGNYDRVNF